MADAKKHSGQNKLLPADRNPVAPLPPAIPQDKVRKSSGASGKSDSSAVPPDQQQPRPSGDDGVQVDIEGDSEEQRPVQLNHTRRNSLLASLPFVDKDYYLESQEEDVKKLEEKRHQELLGIFSRRSVFFCKVWTLLLLYVICLGALIGFYAYLGSLSKRDHNYGIIASLEIFDRRVNFQKDCGRTLLPRQKRQETSVPYSRSCRYQHPQSGALTFLFALNILSIFFVIVMILCRRYAKCYRRPIFIYFWVVIVHWKIAVYYNVGVLAVMGTNCLQMINRLTDIMTRDIELGVNGSAYMGFWDNTQIQGKCCGIYGKSSSLPEWEQLTNGYPLSCCKTISNSSVPGAQMMCKKEDIWDMGCRDRQGVIMGIFAGSGIGLLFLILILSWNLMRILDNHGDSWGMHLLHWGISHDASPTASSVILRHLKISTSGRIVIEGWTDRSMKIVILNYQKDYRFTAVRHTDLLQYACKTPNKIIVGYVQVEILMTAPSKSTLSRVTFANNDQGIVMLTF